MSGSLFAKLPQCPDVASVTSVLEYPSLFVTFSATAIASAIFVFMVAFKYNNVRVFDHKIRTPSISNTLWILFYLFVFLGSLLNALRCALGEISSDVYYYRDRWFEAVTLTLHGLSTLALTMALNHQRRFRSSGSVNVEDSETDPLLKRYDRLKRFMSPLDVLFILICLAYTVLLWVAVAMDGPPRDVVKWVFLGCFSLQRIPPLILTVLIVFFPKAPEPQVLSGTLTEAYQAPEGPSRRAKLLLLLATLLSVSGDVPLSLWTLVAGTRCVFWVGSVVDLLHLFYVAGLILYFAFLRSEYLRNMEECIWGAVQKFQRSFDFKKF